jgi:hypothetical protein
MLTEIQHQGWRDSITEPSEVCKLKLRFLHCARATEFLSEFGNACTGSRESRENAKICTVADVLFRPPLYVVMVVVPARILLVR